MNLEIPHYLKGYTDIRRFVSYSWSLKWPEHTKEILKLSAKLLGIQTESAVEIQGASVLHRRPEKHPEACGIWHDLYLTGPDSFAKI